MRSVVQLHPQSGAAALGALADGLAPADRARLAQALEFAEPLYAGQLLSTGEPPADAALVRPQPPRWGARLCARDPRHLLAARQPPRRGAAQVGDGGPVVPLPRARALQAHRRDAR